MPSRIRIGPDGGPYVIVEEDNGDVNISSPNGNVNFQGDDLSNVGALTADSVNTDETTHRGGEQFGFETSQSLKTAIENHPKGAKFHVPAEFFNISTTIDATAKWIIGAGWHRENNSSSTDDFYGTILNPDKGNLSGDMISVTSGSSNRSGHRFSDVHMWGPNDGDFCYSGETVRQRLQDFSMNLRFGGSGVKLTGDSEFSTVRDFHISGVQGSEKGILIDGTGFQYTIEGGHINGPGGSAGIEITQASHNLIQNGQYNIDGGPDIYLNNQLGKKQAGTTIRQTSHEKAGTAIDINTGGADSWDNVLVDRPSFSNGPDLGVKFGNTAGSRLIYPRLAGTTNDWAEWTADSASCQAVVTPFVLKNGSYTVDPSAFLPSIFCPYFNGSLRNVNTDPNIYIWIWNFAANSSGSQNRTAFWDGSNWNKVADGSVTTFTP